MKLSKKELNNLVSENKFEIVFERLKDYLEEGSILMNDLILTIGMWNETKTSSRRNLIKYDDLSISNSKVRFNLVEIIKDINDCELNDKNSNTESNDDKRKREVQVLLEGFSRDFTEEDKFRLIKAISHNLDISKEEIRVKRIFKGSVKFILELLESHAQQLLKLYKIGKLSFFLNKEYRWKIVKVDYYDIESSNKDVVNYYSEELFKIEDMIRSFSKYCKYLRKQNRYTQKSDIELLNFKSEIDKEMIVFIESIRNRIKFCPFENYIIFKLNKMAKKFSKN